MAESLIVEFQVGAFRRLSLEAGNQTVKINFIVCSRVSSFPLWVKQAYRPGGIVRFSISVGAESKAVTSAAAM